MTSSVARSKYSGCSNLGSRRTYGLTDLHRKANFSLNSGKLIAHNWRCLNLRIIWLITLKLVMFLLWSFLTSSRRLTPSTLILVKQFGFTLDAAKCIASYLYDPTGSTGNEGIPGPGNLTCGVPPLLFCIYTDDLWLLTSMQITSSFI